MSQTATIGESAVRSGKYLTFVLGNESYGVEVLKVREIIRLADITTVPQMPVYVRGVINLRGKIVPVVDLRIKFSLGDGQDGERTCIMVVLVKLPSGTEAMIGLVVDAVEEVINIAETDIEDAPEFGGGMGTDYIMGMAKIKGAVKALLDIDRVIAAEVASLGGSMNLESL